MNETVSANSLLLISLLLDCWLLILTGQGPYVSFLERSLISHNSFSPIKGVKSFVWFSLYTIRNIKALESGFIQLDNLALDMDSPH